jgi:hypothetical protein
VAQITGSTTIDWSTVVIDPPALDQLLNDFSARFDQVLTAVDNGSYSFLAEPTSTSISIQLFTGQIVNFSGFGFDTDDPVINSISYRDPSNGDIMGFSGSLGIHFDGNVSTVSNFTANRLTVGTSGLKETLIGNIVFDPITGDASGPITQMQLKLGPTFATLKGSLTLSNDTITGTVTGLSLVTGTNTLTMSGLKMDFASLDAVTTAGQLFEAVGNQMAGDVTDDTITYTNNSATGMTFFGGGGNDTITIKGLANDTLVGGLGDDL